MVEVVGSPSEASYTLLTLLPSSPPYPTTETWTSTAEVAWAGSASSFSVDIKRAAPFLLVVRVGDEAKAYDLGVQYTDRFLQVDASVSSEPRLLGGALSAEEVWSLMRLETIVYSSLLVRLPPEAALGPIGRGPPVDSDSGDERFSFCIPAELEATASPEVLEEMRVCENSRPRGAEGRSVRVLARDSKLPIRNALVLEFPHSRVVAATNEDGLAQLPEGARPVLVFARGYSPEISAGFGADTGAETVVELQPLTPVFGVVLGARKTPIPGAFVSTAGESLAGIIPMGSSGLSDPDGRFHLHAPDTGDQLVVSAADRVHGAGTATAALRPGHLGPVVLRLEAASACDLALAVTDQNGAPVGGASVLLESWEDKGSVRLAGVTSEQGLFRATNFSPGSFDITIARVGFVDFRIVGERLECHGERPRAVMSRLATSVLEVVYTDGTMAKGASVTVCEEDYHSPDACVRALAGPAGAAHFSTLVEGRSYEAWARSEDGAASGALTFALRVAEDGETVPVRLRLSCTGSVEVRVTDDGGVGLEGAEVALRRLDRAALSGPPSRLAEVSDESGRAVFRGIALGLNRVEAWYQGQSASDSFFVGEEPEEVVLRIAPTEVEILVRSKDGTEVDEASVVVAGYRAKPGLVLEQISPSSWRLQINEGEDAELLVSAPGFAPEALLVRAESAEPQTPLTVHLERGATVGGLVLGAGQPVPECTAELSAPSLRWITLVDCEADGWFSIPNVPRAGPQSMLLRVDSPGFARMDRVLSGSLSGDYLIELEEHYRVTGSIRGLPLGAQVAVTASGPTVSPTARLSANRTEFAIEGLSAGLWLVTADAGSLGQKSETVNLDPTSGRLVELAFDFGDESEYSVFVNIDDSPALGAHCYATSASGELAASVVSSDGSVRLRFSRDPHDVRFVIRAPGVGLRFLEKRQGLLVSGDSLNLFSGGLEVIVEARPEGPASTVVIEADAAAKEGIWSRMPLDVLHGRVVVPRLPVGEYTVQAKQGEEVIAVGRVSIRTDVWSSIVL